MSDDRRLHQRASAPCLTVEVDGAALRERYLRDISQGGLYVETSQVLPVDREITIELQLPERDNPLTLSGCVARVELDQSTGESIPCGMGIRFVGLSAAAERDLAALLVDHGELEEPLGEEVDESTSAERCHELIAALERKLQSTAERLARLREDLQHHSEEDASSRLLTGQLVQRLDTTREQAATAQASAFGELLENNVALRGQLDERAAERVREREAAESDYARAVLAATEVAKRAEEARATRQAAKVAAHQRITTLEGELEDHRRRTETVAEELNVERARARVVELERELSVAEAAAAEGVDELRLKLSAVTDEIAEVEGKVSSTREDRNAVVERLDHAKANYQRLRARRRDMERLLSMMGDSADGIEVSEILGEDVDLDEVLASGLGSTAAPDGAAAAAGPVVVAEEAAEDEGEELDADEETLAAIVEEPIGSDEAVTGGAVEEPEPATTQPSESATTKPSESATTKPSESATAKPSESATAKPSEPFEVLESEAPVVDPATRKFSRELFYGLGLMLLVLAAVGAAIVFWYGPKDRPDTAMTDQAPVVPEPTVEPTEEVEALAAAEPADGTAVEPPVDMVDAVEPVDGSPVAPELLDAPDLKEPELIASPLTGVVADDGETPVGEDALATDEIVAAAFQQGADLLRRGRFRSAIEQFQLVLEHRPRNEPALMACGKSYLELGATRKSIPYFKRALAANPRNRRAYQFLGNAYAELNDKVKARQAYEAFLAREPKGPRADEVRFFLEQLK